MLATQALAMPEAPADGPAALVANINQTVDYAAGSSAHSFTTAGRYTYFIADDGEVGEALWRTDGTTDGTLRLASVETRTSGARVGQPVAVGDQVVLPVDGDLWRSDGTPAGTVLVRPGEAYYVTAVAEAVFFIEDEQLWRLDPRRGAAQLVMPVGGPPRLDLFGLVGVGDLLLFAACRVEEGCELWRSDGTAAGTVIVRDLAPGPPSGLSLPSYRSIVIGDLLYFIARDAAHGAELWRSDGTAAGTRRVKDIRRGADSAFLVPSGQSDGYLPLFTAVGGTLFFVASDGISGFELWRTDGRADGTRMVGDLVPGPDGLFDCAAELSECQPRWPELATAVAGDRLFFIARQVIAGESDYRETTQLWRSDGTAAGTTMIEADDDLDIDRLGTEILAHGDRVFFTRSTFIHPATTLWAREADGMVSERVADVFDYAELRHGSDLGLVMVPWRGEPWWSDGTEAGTYLLKDIRGDDASSLPLPLGALGDRLLFSADDGLHGFELWRSDGSAAGTELAADVSPGLAGSDPRLALPIDGELLLLAVDGTHGRELWRSDGTAAGTTLVADVRPGSPDSDAAKFARAGGRVYFVADDGVHGRELWITDLGGGDTRLVRDLRPGSESGVPGSDWQTPIAVIGDVAYFGADDGVSGYELWRSDGTAAGTELVSDLVPGAGHSYPGGITAWDGRLFFTTQPVPVPGGEIIPLWRSDGSATGTVRIADLPSAYGQFLVQGDVAYFTTYSRDALWRIDGVDGTPREIESPVPYELLDAGGTLIGLRNDGIWRLGHGLIHQSWGLGELAAFGRRTVFMSGRYWDWRTIGSSGGIADSTVEIQRLAAPEDGTDNYHCEQARFARAGGSVFFAAQVGDIGCELWAVPVEALAEVCVEDCPPPPTATPTEPPRTPSPTPSCHGADCTQIVGEEASGARGETVSVGFSLRAQGTPIAALLADVAFAPGVEIAANGDGRPDCRIDPAIDKPASAFVFQPYGCRPGRNCRAVRALVLALDNVKPIADGSALFSCAVEIGRRAGLGRHVLPLASLEAASPAGEAVEVSGVAPGVTVLGDGTTGSRAAGGDGCQVGSQASVWQWLGLLVLLLKPPRRRG